VRNTDTVRSSIRSDLKFCETGSSEKDQRVIVKGVSLFKESPRDIVEDLLISQCVLEGRIAINLALSSSVNN